MTTMSSQKVSFTVRRRPTPVSRATSSGPESDSGSSFKIPALPRHLNDSSTPGSPLARSGTSSPYHDRDSDSDEDDQAQDELVTGFDNFGVQRLHERRKPQGPLVIPALKNRDWREAARKRRTLSQYVPESARAQTVGSDGSVGGLGTKDVINNSAVVSGLQLRRKEETLKLEEDVDMTESSVTQNPDDETLKEEEDEDKIALHALLAGTDSEYAGPRVDVIPTPVSEQEAYKQDVEGLPDSSTLADYERVPVSQFGAAMLRGMGWKEGTAASRKGNGIIQPYIPESRPALLGIGAKEMETLDDGSKKSSSRRPEKRYIPVVKKDKDGNVVSEGDGRKRDSERERRRARSISPRRDSRVSSRRSSPDRRSRGDNDRRRDHHKGREYDDDSDKDRERSRRDKYRDDDRDRNHRERADKDRDHDYRRDESRHSERRR
ncbi:hypothetical protein D9757_005624 [Collybiopsis confluens]|uniref:G-patch domain-containing protein n=1 Tax=Collybiopsis confluens TaxID=2823264 RepID=A0A8H5MCH5_9AGAR|nr:hypothetical protein D9757_005624 [Collybiopsis confluens]